MDKESAKKLIKNTFQKSFNKNDFVYFTKNLLNQYDETKAFHARGYVLEAFRKYIKTYERIGTYIDPEGKKIDILIVYLKRESTVDRARTAQRNFIARYLKERGEKDAGLIAFVSPQEEDWRFSFVKMEYKFEKTPKGDVKVKEEFTPARRYSFLVGKNESSHTAQSCFVDILVNDIYNLKLNEVEKAFNIEKVTKEFYEKYRNLFLQVKDTIDDVVKEDEEVRQEFQEKGVNVVDFSKKLLGQIVFLYFLQKKGWFGVKKGQKWDSGSKHFLRELFEKKHCHYKNFFNDVLEPLFYEALRNDRSYDDHYFSYFNCKIPFLNGGLFDPINDYDWAKTDILLPDTLFSNQIKTKEGDIGTGILDIFDRYNFTVKEDEPLEKEVAVDPEMLGKVFENLLEVKDRKSKGTYYTPREIVHYMCQQSLINYLYTEVNSKRKSRTKEEKNQMKLLGKPDPIQQSLIIEKDSTIISKEDIEKLIKYGDTTIENDNHIVIEGEETKRYSFNLPENIRKNAERIDEVLKNIRVCDPAIGSGAFPVGMMNEIIRARNVLTSHLLLKGTETTKQYRTIYNFKRHTIQNCLYGVDIDPGAVEIAKLRLWLSLIVDEEDIKLIKPLPNLDYKIVCGNSLLGVERNLENWKLFAKLEELKPLFFNETNTSKKQDYKMQIDGIISKITNGHKDFDFEVYFSEVFHENNGFDVVIANPPYEEISNRKETIFFQQTYTEVLSGHYDLYIFFFKKAFNIVKRKGIITFITAHTYLHYPQFKNLRKWLYKKSHILEITSRISGIFESAVVDNAIILMQAYAVNDNDLSKFTQKKIKNNKLIDEEKLFLRRYEFSSDNFDLETIKNRETLKKYLKNTELLGEITKSSQGITVYAKVQGEKKDWLRKEKIDSNSKPIFRGREIQRYFSKWSGDYIQYGNWLWCPRNPKFFENEKLFFRQTADTLIGTYVREPIYCIDSVHSIINLPNLKNYSLKYILAILNSKMGNYLYKLLIPETGKVFAQVKLFFLRQIPIKKISISEQKPFIDFVNKILAITKEDDYLANSTKQAKVKEYKRQIDEMVYQLYDLTDNEIKIVEEFSK